jgi:hypothetical protein
MDKLFAMLRDAVDRSNGRLKYPKLILPFGADDIVRVQMVQRGKYAGQLKVVCTTREGRYGPLWMGTISKDGTWTLPRVIDDKDASLYQEVASVLGRLADDPAATAKELAIVSKNQKDPDGKDKKVAGNCCFCGLELTDPRSRKHGYGKTCAGHYDLQWGTK